ncbi:hypothetical protein L7F22_015418 [Adiantum nelumboides]|nr:hypothetical protein [Adiantum nelumboides]
MALALSAWPPRRSSSSSGKKLCLNGVRGGGNLVDPEWLHESLPDDYEFDPLGLGKDTTTLKWYKEAQIIHGRWAMPVIVGIFARQSWINGIRLPLIHQWQLKLLPSATT